MEEVIWLSLLLMAAANANQMQGALSFQNYTSRSDWKTPAPELIDLARACQFDIGIAESTFAVNYGEQWSTRSNLKNSGDDSETDLYRTLEIWKTSSGDQLVSWWDISADTADEDELMICYSRSRNMTEIVSTIRRFDPASGDQQFRAVRRDNYLGSIAVSRSVVFLDRKGKPTSNPNISSEDRKSIEEKIDAAQVIKMLLKSETQIRKK